MKNCSFTIGIELQCKIIKYFYSIFNSVEIKKNKIIFCLKMNKNNPTINIISNRKSSEEKLRKSKN